MADTRPYRAVAERIRELIRDKQFRAGERLPAERELAALLGVSRGSLREGLVALELVGEIEIRGGSGIYVGSEAARPADAPRSAHRPHELQFARSLIEAEVAAMAAKKASDRAVHAILAAMLEAERSLADGSCSEQAERKFHLAIAHATGNAALVGVVEYLWPQCGGPAKGPAEEAPATAMHGRRALLDAIAARDAGRARKAMRLHLARRTL
ncbi:MAG TPA: FCD domain-containing protein [Telluria sp.]|nr:FCD domain-containing protein [Telluria sp.]